MFVEFTEIERFNFNCIHSIYTSDHGTTATKEINSSLLAIIGCRMHVFSCDLQVFLALVVAITASWAVLQDRDEGLPEARQKRLGMSLISSAFKDLRQFQLS